MQTRVWAHRGASAYAPENTLEAFAKAVEMNADGIELDVHLSADGELIVSHDGTLGRMTDIEGPIASMTRAEIQSAHANKGFEEQYPDAYVPTLAEVYDLLRPTDLFINVEIKVATPAIYAMLYDLSIQTRLRDRIIYSSFKERALIGMQELDPCVRTGLLYSEYLAYPWIHAESFRATALHPNQKRVFELDYAYVMEAHKRGIMVNPWTVDNPKSMQKLTELGCDALITNCPDIARTIVDRCQYR